MKMFFSNEFNNHLLGVTLLLPSGLYLGDEGGRHLYYANQIVIREGEVIKFWWRTALEK